MKYCIVSLSLLLSLFALSLRNGRILQQNMDTCLMQMESAQRSATSQNWNDVLQSTQAAYDHWQSRQTYLHIVCHRDTLNTAESLFRRCLILACDEDAPEFHSNAAELISQLEALGDMESFSIKHVF